MYSGVLRGVVLLSASALLVSATSCVFSEEEYTKSAKSRFGYDEEEIGELCEDSVNAGEHAMVEDSQEHRLKVYFALNKSALDEQSRSVLQAIAQELQNNESYYLKIEGHCDIRGEPQYNLCLGERRATAVKNYLVGTHGIASHRIQVVSYGSAKLEVPGTNEEAHSKNRRAVFKIVRPKALSFHSADNYVEHNPAGQVDWGVENYSDYSDF